MPSVPGDEEAQEGLLEEWRSFASAEADLLCELGSIIDVLRDRAKQGQPFDEQKIWDAVERALLWITPDRPLGDEVD